MTSTTISSQGHQVSEALGLWEPTRTLTLEAARRHSQRIRFFQRLLILTAALLTAGLCWQFAKQAPPGGLPKDNPNDSVKMINPRYSGRTADNLPYKLKAAFATRERANADEVLLEAPVLTFLRAAGAEESTIKAESGTYDDITKILNLTAAVRLETDDGYDCRTTHARIFAREKRIEGDERIECVGSFGEVNGNAYEILEDYSVFVFKDGIDALLERDVTSVPDAIRGED